MKVLGVSGSPINNSNTDRAVLAVLEATGVADTEFVKLSNYRLDPCRACLGCANTNRCVLDDDGNLLAGKVRDAAALVVGGFTPYSSLDARTVTFLERLYPLRHRKGLMQGKPGAAVITTCVPEADNPMLPPAGDMGVNAIRFYMMEEGMEFLGAVKISGNVPCMKCGRGDTCKTSGVKMLYGADATTESVGIHVLEDQLDIFEQARALGRELGAKLKTD
jgi:multimeric flavodoxin WrbA